VLTSPTMEEGGELPTEHTCDGGSATPPLEWSGAPDGTVGYAIAMHHVPGPGDTHWYWRLWNIPADVTSVETNTKEAGDIGTNSVNGANEYAPPCSQGPGEKTDTFTVYALSTQPDLPEPSMVTLEVLLDAIDGDVLDSAELNVIYDRDTGETQP
jgi:phosphatidylethanolamine-binding protein (PEBP) family uncharacterized protein